MSRIDASAGWNGSCTRNRVARGFTLIETLLVLAVLAMLLAIVFPTLGTIRENARNAVTLQNLRTHVSTFQVYQGTYKDYFPYFTSPDGPVYIEYRGKRYKIQYFGAFYRWQIALARDYYDNVAPHPSQRRPGGNQVVSYQYSATCLADPAFWNAETRTGPDQWRAVRGAEVVFPSRKALFTESEPIYPTIYAFYKSPESKINLGMMDGSAHGYKLRELTLPHRTGEGDFEGTMNHIGLFGMHTKMGVRGRDIK
jgi:prepilin-type N-terminal cleavage/methylation domain-containing protein